jgi:hypothetical protein
MADNTDLTTAQKKYSISGNLISGMLDEPATD